MMLTASAIVWIIGDLVLGGMMVKSYLEHKKQMSTLKARA